MRDTILARFEQHAPLSVMMREAMEHALSPEMVDQVFEQHRQRQYSRELLFSTVVELMGLVALGQSPSLHAAARKLPQLPVSLTALYDKIRRTQPGVMRALVQENGRRVAALSQELGMEPSLPGWRLRIVDGNHLPASDKRLGALKGRTGAMLPGYSLVVYDPDLEVVVDLLPSEDAYQHERVTAQALFEPSQPGQLWIADRNFCATTTLAGWEASGSGFLVREHACHPRLSEAGPWQACGRIDSGEVHEQRIATACGKHQWRRIALHLDAATGSAETTIRLWSNLPQTVPATQLAQLYRKRWRIEGMFQRLESVLHSEIRSFGQPQAALLGFTVAVMAYNVLSVLKRSVERAHRERMPTLEVSAYHLAESACSAYAGMMVALPEEVRRSERERTVQAMVERLLSLARHVRPEQIRISRRGPKVKVEKSYVDSRSAQAHASTARVLRNARRERP